MATGYKVHQKGRLVRFEEGSNIIFSFSGKWSDNEQLLFTNAANTESFQLERSVNVMQGGKAGGKYFGNFTLQSEQINDECEMRTDKCTM